MSHLDDMVMKSEVVKKKGVVIDNVIDVDSVEEAIEMIENVEENVYEMGRILNLSDIEKPHLQALALVGIMYSEFRVRAASSTLGQQNKKDMFIDMYTALRNINRNTVSLEQYTDTVEILSDMNELVNMFIEHMYGNLGKLVVIVTDGNPCGLLTYAGVENLIYIDAGCQGGF